MKSSGSSGGEGSVVMRMHRVARLVAEAIDTPPPAREQNALGDHDDLDVLRFATHLLRTRRFLARHTVQRADQPADIPERPASFPHRQTHRRCSAVTARGTLCKATAEWGLCDAHKQRLDKRMALLRELEALQGKCLARSRTGKPCRNDAGRWGLCGVHEEIWHREVFENIVLKPERPASSSPPSLSLFDRPAPTNAEEARARIREVLSLRRFVPDPNEAYTIPFEDLSLRGRLALGPSLVEGDYPVSFWYFDKGAEEIEVAYGERGDKAGRDMPLASQKLYDAMSEWLKLLPGYTETCEATGKHFEQPLGTICYMLLRGAITVEEIRFSRFSPEAKGLLQKNQAARELPPTARKLLHRSPVEIARALIAGHVDRQAALRVLRALWGSGLTDQEIEAVVSYAIFKPSTPRRGSSARRRPRKPPSAR